MCHSMALATTQIDIRPYKESLEFTTTIYSPSFFNLKLFFEVMSFFIFELQVIPCEFTVNHRDKSSMTVKI